jgi:hypothetical protein
MGMARGLQNDAVSVHLRHMTVLYRPVIWSLNTLLGELFDTVLLVHVI